MTGQRVIRGFRRLGMVLAAPFLVAAVVQLGLWAYSGPSEWWKTDQVVTAAASGDPWEKYLKPPSAAALPPIPDGFELVRPARTPDQLIIAGLLAGAGTGLFLLCLALGWVIAGFVRDQEA